MSDVVKLNIVDILSNKDKTVGLVKLDNKELEQNNYQTAVVREERIYEALKFIKKIDDMIGTGMHRGISIHVRDGGVLLMSTEKMREQGVYVAVSTIVDVIKMEVEDER